MNLHRRTLVAGLSVALLGASLAVHAADTLDTIKQRKKIVIAVDIGSPPYGYLDDKAQQAGSDIETAKLLAKDLGVELEIVPVTGPNRVPFLTTRKADIVVASFSITDERKKVIDYSVPYGVVPVVVAGPKKAKLKSFADLSGKTVAVTRGTTSDLELGRGIKEVANVTVVRYEDDATTNTAIATGQQDFLAASPTAVDAVLKANPSRDVETKFLMKAYPCGIGIRKNEPELKAWLDAWVQTNLKNGKLNDIYKRHFGMSMPADMLK